MNLRVFTLGVAFLAGGAAFAGSVFENAYSYAEKSLFDDQYDSSKRTKSIEFAESMKEYTQSDLDAFARVYNFAKTSLFDDLYDASARSKSFELAKALFLKDDEQLDRLEDAYNYAEMILYDDLYDSSRRERSRQFALQLMERSQKVFDTYKSSYQFAFERMFSDHYDTSRREKSRAHALKSVEGIKEDIMASGPGAKKDYSMCLAFERVSSIRRELELDLLSYENRRDSVLAIIKKKGPLPEWKRELEQSNLNIELTIKAIESLNTCLGLSDEGTSTKLRKHK